MSKNRLIDWITEEAAGEEIQAVVIGRMGWAHGSGNEDMANDYGCEDIPNYVNCPVNKVLSLEEARPWLEYSFDAGYGSPGCQSITAWTPNKVIFISQYDGSTSVESVPRNPVDHEPKMPGG